jgi:hypothetical protein
MEFYRVSKYNPEFRNEQGIYTRDDWTDISDVGKVFNNELLTMEKYQKVENRYISVILLILNELKESKIMVMELEKYALLPDIDVDENMAVLWVNLVEKSIIEKNISDIVRLILRGCLWAKLESSEIKIHFGYDLYMYIGLKKRISKTIIENMRNQSMFIEPFQSPYN